MLSRRTLLTSTTVLLLAGCSGESRDGARPGLSPSPSPTPQALDLSDLERSQHVRIGLAAIGAEGTRLVHRESERFAFCSTIKTYAAGAILHRVDGGKLALDRELAVQKADVIANSPLSSTHAGGTMTVAALCRAALTVSDNAAVNVLVRELGGPAEITAFARSLGDTVTRADRTEPTLNTAIAGDPRDTTTPAGFAGGYQRLLLGDALRPASRLQLLTWMRATKTSDHRFRAGVPRGWTTADKTGTGDHGATNDAGVLLSTQQEPTVLVVLTDQPGSTGDAPANEGVIAEATRRVVVALG